MRVFKRIFFKIIFLVFTIACNNHVTVEKYDNGNIKSMGRIINEKRDGSWIFFKENGDTLKIENFELGILKSELEFIDNRVLKRTSYSGDKTVLEETFYENGTIDCIFPVKNGVQNGHCECYFQNGQIRSSYNVSNGIPYGEYREYYKDGNPKLISDQIGNGIHYYFDSLGNSRILYFKDFEQVDSVEYHQIK